MTSAVLEDQLLEVPEVCRALGFGRTKVYNLLRSEKLLSVKIGQARRVRTSDLNRFVAELLAVPLARSHPDSPGVPDGGSGGGGAGPGRAENP